MNFAAASRVLALIGITINGVALSYWTSMWSDSPLFNWFEPWFLIWTALSLAFCLVLPAIGYGEVRPQSKGIAFAILIISGLASPMIGNYIGLAAAIPLLFAGGLAALWNPLAKEGESPATS